MSTINAIGLRHSAECCKPSTHNNSVSFARREKGESKTGKAAAVIGSLALLAGLATAAYIFRGKIANSKIYKKAMEQGGKVVDKTKDLTKEAFEKLHELKDSAAKKAAEFKNNAKPKAAEIWDKIAENANKLYEQMKKVVPNKK